MVFRNTKLIAVGWLAFVGAWYMPSVLAVPSAEEQVVIARIETALQASELSRLIRADFAEAIKERDCERVAFLYVETFWYVRDCLGEHIAEGVSDASVEAAVERMRKKYAYDLIVKSDYSVEEFEKLRECAVNEVLCHENREPGRTSLLQKINEGRRNAPASLWSRSLQKLRRTYQSASSFLADIDVRTRVYTACRYVGSAINWSRVALVSLWNRYKS